MKKDPALSLVRSLKSYAQLQSTVDYLRNPPSGYLWEPIDVPRLLDAIETKVLAKDTYESEYDFQVDLQSTMIKARDGHLAFTGDLLNAFVWVRPFNFSLVSVSKDGKEMPQVYRAQDILDISASSVDVKTNYKASPIKSINGMDVETFLLAEANSDLGQDPDNNWNTRMFRIQDAFSHDNNGQFNTPNFYPGPTTVIQFQNGTTATLNNIAIAVQGLSGVTSAEDMYKKFCVPSSSSSSSSNKKRSLDMKEVKKSVPAIVRRQTNVTGSYYPKPAFADSKGVVLGYYSEDKTVAVLAIYTFLPGTKEVDLLSFQSTITNFFADAMKKGVQKLVIDLQGNTGGSLDLATDLIVQLFPTIPPNSKDNMRASVGMHGIMLAASNLATEADALDAKTNAAIDDALVPFAYQEVMTPEVKRFNYLSDFYGPAHVGNGFFTNFFQGNYTNDAPSQFGIPGIVVTGTGNRKGFKQPFKPENIIMVMDGVCASACTIFSEHMKQLGVQSIAIGGRPQTGPMQAVGGTKGSQVFTSNNLGIMIQLFQNKTLNTELSSAKGTVFEYFNRVPISRSDGSVGVNGRNQFRIGDTTQTPLQFVYEAADCKIWYTPEMAADPTEIWDRVAKLAFGSRQNGVIDSPYCVKDSTKHATSLSGGLKKGDIGPQTPPANAKSKVQGLLIAGKEITGNLASGKVGSTSPVDPSATTKEGGSGATGPDIAAAVSTMVDVCKGYKGQEWFVQLMCAAISKQG